MLLQAIFYLALAIGFEIIGTICLRLSDGFSKWPYVLGLTLGYGLAFWLLSLSLKAGMPLGMAYAIWSGLGTALITLIGFMIFKEPMAVIQWLGVGCIILGVALLNLGGHPTH